MRIIVKIDSEDNNLIERRFFEHAAMRDNVAFLMKDEDVNEEILDRLVKNVGTLYYALEKTKRLLSKKYEPIELKEKPYNYAFDFEDETITYVNETD